MSSLPPEIASKKLPSQLLIRAMEDGEIEVSTVGELHDFLQTLGLEVTTSDAVDWSLTYPDHAIHATRICELQQQIADLSNELSAVLALPAELKRAAE